ncbi:MAG: carbohydrate kinase family protein [Anaerolineae bacterium]|jgi:ribokinase
MPDVVALGDANVDIIAHFGHLPAKGEDALASSTEIHCGGSAANTAMVLARMGIETNLISRVGPDSWALKIFSCLNDAGVSPSSLQRDATAMTGLMYVIVTPDGERTILGNRGANVYTDPNQIREEAFREARLFHLSGYSLLQDPQRSAALRALEIACRYNLTITMDPGMAVPQQALDEMHALLPVVDVLLPSLAEAQQLTGKVKAEQCAQALVDLGVSQVALKLGAEGCLVADRDRAFRVPGFVVQTRDSTGAGDNFDAGLIAGFLRGLGWHGAAVLGNVLGAMAAARVGGGTALPDMQDILALLRDQQAEPDQQGLKEAIQQVSHFVAGLVTEPEEEDKPWWN